MIFSINQERQKLRKKKKKKKKKKEKKKKKRKRKKKKKKKKKRKKKKIIENTSCAYKNILNCSDVPPEAIIKILCLTI